VTLTDVNEFVIPDSLIEQTLQPLRDAGKQGYEAFVVWGGQKSGSAQFTFAAAYFPEQTASQTPSGLLVEVSGDALFRVNRAFYEHGLTLGAQVHSHPTDAYHSDTDDTYPLMTLLGGLSVVIPDFGRGGRSRIGDWAWYRLVGPGAWEPLGVETRIRIA
jgi:hypothetical protein